MRHARWALVLAGTIALVTTTATTARAANVAAEALFKEGRALLAQGRVDEACDRFKRSGELEPRVGTLLNVGECFEHTKQYASAWGAFREAANLAAKESDDREGLAREKAALVEKRAARLTLSVVAPLPPGASVTRNGARVDPAALDTAIPVDPGTQNILVTAPDRKPWRGKLELREGQAGKLEIPALEVLSVAEHAGPDVGSGAGTQSKVAVGLEIGGGVVLATGLVFGALALSTWSSVKETCPGGRCASVAERDRLDSDQGRASTFATVSTVTTLVGGAALATGIVLHLTAPSRRVSIAPTFERTGGGFMATLRL